MEINFKRIENMKNELEQFSKMETDFFNLEKSFKDKWEGYVRDGWDLTLYYVEKNYKKIGILGYTIRDAETDEDFRKVGEKYSFLLVIALDKKFRGNGFGKKMMKKFIEDSDNRAVQSMALRVDLKNKNAHALYKKTGFEEYSKNENSIYLQMRFNKDI